ncbi:MAG: class II glutamine amidotransferase [Candidatus Binatia bacterium]|jgi:glutamine amidotransferase|nr:class II glutamine amidotransferase [Candidatus Binatia bacterium]
MCRLLLVKAAHPFVIQEQLERLAHISKNNKEYQGHGWGCAYLEDNMWRLYKNIKPIWEDDLSQFGRSTLLLGHARSAFKNEGITIENNMPFYDDPYVFIFNGELRGVRITEEGRIGGEKIFNVIKRLNKGDMLKGLKTGVDLIQKRTKYVRALNVILADKTTAYVASVFNEDPDYFTMHYKQVPDRLLICSEAPPGEDGWRKIDNHTVRPYP